MKHYRCYEVHIQKMLAKRIADTITFLPHNITMPNIISISNALAQIKDLIKLLKNHSLAHHNDNSLSALNTLADIFKLNQSNKAIPNVSKPYPIQPPRVPIPTNSSSPRVNKTKPSNNNTSTNN